jgi:hypothetical protein
MIRIRQKPGTNPYERWHNQFQIDDGEWHDLSSITQVDTVATILSLRISPDALRHIADWMERGLEGKPDE